MSQTFFKRCFIGSSKTARRRAGGWLLVAFCYALVGASISCVRLPRHVQATTAAITSPVQAEQTAAPRVNINTAPRAELEQLPGVGPGIAVRIIEYRTRYGPFRRVEHLLIVRGISERRFAQIRPLIKAE